VSTKFIFTLMAFLTITLAQFADAQPKMQQIGILVAGTPASMKTRVDAFRQRLKELGWVEGQNIAFEYRYAEGKLENLEKAVTELIGLNVDLIVAASLGVEVAKKTTSTIPIVMMSFGGDPVEAGLVASLAKPGGNVTGVMGEELTGNRFEIFKEALPKLSRVAAFWTQGVGTQDFKQLQSVAQSLKVQIRSFAITKHADIDSAFAQLARNRPIALFAVGAPIINSGRVQVIDHATKARLPTMCPDARWVNDGGLMAYSYDPEDQSRRSAIYVDRILKGTKPADLPVEAPRKFDVVINLKTAKLIGVMIQPEILARATRVIR
jgi:putative tryptophan/tyrosine transport system substrate-binding protein